MESGEWLTTDEIRLQRARRPIILNARRFSVRVYRSWWMTWAIVFVTAPLVDLVAHRVGFAPADSLPLLLGFFALCLFEVASALGVAIAAGSSTGRRQDARLRIPVLQSISIVAWVPHGTDDQRRFATAIGLLSGGAASLGLVLVSGAHSATLLVATVLIVIVARMSGVDGAILRHGNIPPGYAVNQCAARAFRFVTRDARLGRPA